MAEHAEVLLQQIPILFADVFRNHFHPLPGLDVLQKRGRLQPQFLLSRIDDVEQDDIVSPKP